MGRKRSTNRARSGPRPALRTVAAAGPSRVGTSPAMAGSAAGRGDWTVRQTRSQTRAIHELLSDDHENHGQGVVANGNENRGNHDRANENRRGQQQNQANRSIQNQQGQGQDGDRQREMEQREVLAGPQQPSQQQQQAEIVQQQEQVQQPQQVQQPPQQGGIVQQQVQQPPQQQFARQEGQGHQQQVQRQMVQQPQQQQNLNVVNAGQGQQQQIGMADRLLQGNFASLNPVNTLRDNNNANVLSGNNAVGNLAATSMSNSTSTIPAQQVNNVGGMLGTQQGLLNFVNTSQNSVTSTGDTIVNNTSTNAIVQPNIDSQSQLINYQAIQQQQLGFTPLTSVCSPLGSNVPQNLKTKIVNGEYVDFAVLLDKSEGDQSQPWRQEEQQAMALSVNQGGQIIWKSNKPKQYITSIHSWTSAFLVYSAIYLAAHPHRVQEMLKYANVIRTASSRFGGWGWRTYDQQFRMRQQGQPQRSWGVIDGELWALYVSTPRRVSNFG